MSDSLLNLPVKDTPVASQDYAKIQPYIPPRVEQYASPKQNAFHIKPYAIICIVFIILSLSFWDNLFSKLNPYMVMAIKTALFAVTAFFVLRYVR